MNIPRSVDDPFHRYKMPDVMVKNEGKGNGVKTVLSNIADIARALKRPPQYPTKFIAFQYGALSTMDPENERYVVNGTRSKEEIARVCD